MSSGKRSLRFQSSAEMPSGMRALYEKQLAPAPVTSDAPVPNRGSKYGAIPTMIDGIRFSSKREAKYYEELKLRRLAGDVRYFLRQVPIHLMSGVRYVVDFVVFHANGDVSYIDVKGMTTPVFRVKQREVEAQYPITIEIVR